MQKQESHDFERMLREHGIKFKGYGVLPKYVMFDKDLTAESKGLYALICSYAGDKNYAYPSRNTITTQLGIGKDRFYRHFALLLEQGYIEKEHHRNEHRKFSHNVYILVAQPKKFMDAKREITDPYESGIYRRVRESNLKAIGYGLIPKALIEDERLDIKAKTIYAYLGSVKDARTNTSKVKKSSLLSHLSISEKTCAKYCRQLVGYGYISVMYSNNIHTYTLHEYPCKNEDMEVRQKSGMNIRKNKDTVYPQNRDTDTPQNKDAIITTANSTNLMSINQSVETVEISKSALNDTDDLIDKTNGKNSDKRNTKLIKDNLKSQTSYSKKKIRQTSSNAKNEAGKQRQEATVPYNIHAAPEEIAAVKQELMNNIDSGKLMCFVDDKYKMRVAVEALFSANNADNSDTSAICELVKNCTVQMLCSNTKTVNGADYRQILDKFNDSIEVDYDGNMTFNWISNFISKYIQKLPKYDIKDIFAYTRTSILHHLYVASMEKEVSSFIQPERKSSFDIEKFFRASVDKAMRAD